ncbi:MAG: hypothetical protein H7175_09475, partial [Burkholderiales bacterium]|nr:hypothetical protein [Anaerolineae bacterium]
LAHGALGAFDEVIFLSVGFLFIVVMGISWVHSRNNPPVDDADSAEPTADTDAASPATDSAAPDHFRLD